MKFWHDVWCGDNHLSMCFPDIFKINNDKEAYVADLMQFPNGVLSMKHECVSGFGCGCGTR